MIQAADSNFLKGNLLDKSNYAAAKLDDLQNMFKSVVEDVSNNTSVCPGRQEVAFLAHNASALHSAFCLHELGQTEAARKVLLDGPATLHAEPVFHYNLACYECMLGNLELARVHLEKTFDLDKKFRDYAKTDPDLERLRENE